MKPTRKDLATRNESLALENNVLVLALHDVALGRFKTFGDTAFTLMISRPAGAAGGIVTVVESGTVSAHYWETFRRGRLETIAAIVTGDDSDYNRNLIRQRELIEAADAYVGRAQSPDRFIAP